MERQIKRTYSLPENAVRPFEDAVEPGKRSSVVAGLIREWLERRQRERLRHEVREGCHAMADIARETAREYLPLEEELEHGLNPKG